MAREDLGDLLPHARDAQGVDKTLELALSRTLNAFEYVLRGLLRHALEAREGLDILAPELVLVVQGRVGDGGAAHEHRLEARHRGQGPGAPHLHVDTENLRGLLLRRILVGQRKARRARHEAEPLLPIEPVHLVDHAIDGVRKPVARLSHLPVIAEQPFGALHQLALLRYAKPELDEPRKRLRLPAPARPRGAADGIGEEPERPRRGHARIELAHRAGGGVARVDVLLFSQLALARVEGVEVAAVPQDLAAHPLCGRVRSRQFGMRRFQGKKLLKQPVIFGVIDLRLVLDVVEPVMVFEGFPESFAALPDISRHAHENSRSASGLPGSMPRSASMCRTASTAVPMAASARSSTGLPLSSTRRAPCAAASWRPLRAIAWKLRAGSGVRTTSSVRVMPSSRGVTWKACSPASISAIAAPTTCSATWMSAWAHTRSRLCAASSAWRISGAETLAPSFAASVSTSERNSRDRKSVV